MKRIIKALNVRGRAVRLANWNLRATPGCKDKDEAAERLAQNLARIDTLQYLLYGEARRSLLIVLKGMDTAGKDGVIRKALTAFNPQGCKVWPFKVPTPSTPEGKARSKAAADSFGSLNPSSRETAGLGILVSYDPAKRAQALLTDDSTASPLAGVRNR